MEDAFEVGSPTPKKVPSETHNGDGTITEFWFVDINPSTNFPLHLQVLRRVLRWSRRASRALRTLSKYRRSVEDD